MKKTINISLILLLFSASNLLAQKSNIDTNSLDEGYFTMKYSRLVRSNIKVLIAGDQTYLPITTILTKLKVYNSFEPGESFVSGFFINKDSLFNIDFRKMRASISNRQFAISKKDFLTNDLEYYVTPELLNKIFDLNIQVDQSFLVININSFRELPVLTEYKRKSEYQSLNQDFEQNWFPLVGDRQWHWLSAGALDYNASMNYSALSNNFSYNINTGFELLGGDLQFDYNGYYQNPVQYHRDNYNYRWRYYFDDNNYLSQVQIGYTSTYSEQASAIPVLNFRGIRITNQPIAPESVFSAYEIDGKTEPGWQTEFYLNGRLFSQSEADTNGNYKYSFPLNYGGTSIKTAIYGNKGEYYESCEQIRVPLEFLRPGLFRYSVNAGEIVNTNDLMVNGILSVGITSWLTNSLSITKQSEKDGSIRTTKMPDIYNHLGARISQDIIAGLDFSTDLYRLSLNSDFKRFGSYNLSYSAYNGKSPVNTTGYNSYINFSGSIPELLSLPLNLYFYGSRSDYNEFDNNILRANISYRLMPVYFSLGYMADALSFKSKGNSRLSQTATADMTLSWTGSRLLSLLGLGSSSHLQELLTAGRLRFNASFDLARQNLSGILISFRQDIFRSMTLGFSAGKDLRTNSMQLSADLVLNLNPIRSTTRFLGTQSGSAISQQVQGSACYDNETGRFYLNNSFLGNSVGFGAASVRFFLDENHNNIYDENEKEIKGESEILNASYQKSAQTTFNLNPYSRYNVVTRPESFKNPLYRPAIKEFSFITEPNSLRQINIPCYTAGIIEGNIVRVDKNTRSTQPGLKIHIESEDSSFSEVINAFSDGSFYYMGLMPGKYRIFIDSLQLKYLNLKASYSLINFTVKPDKDGDYIGDLNFEVYPVSKQGTTAKKDIVNKSESLADTVSANGSGITLIDSDTASSGNSRDSIRTTKEANTSANVFTELKTMSYDNSRATALTNEMKAYLDMLADYIKSNPNSSIVIDAHTDNSGTMAQTRQISEKRAEAAVKYLTGKGIAHSRILAKGHGSLYPVSSNITPEGRKKNRRLEIRIIKKH